jgi:hypothetical protein
VLSDNRRGLVVPAASDGTAERDVAAQMLAGVAKPGKRVTAGADNAYDTKGFVKACCEINVTPHVAQNTSRNGGSAIDGRTGGTSATRSASASGSASSSASAGASSLARCDRSWSKDWIKSTSF